MAEHSAVPQRDVASTLSFLREVTSQIAPNPCSTRAVSSSRISCRNCWTYGASIHAAPRLAWISAGCRSRGWTFVKAATLIAKRFEPSDWPGRSVTAGCCTDSAKNPISFAAVRAASTTPSELVLSR